MTDLNLVEHPIIINKQNDKVAFNTKEHVYWNVDTLKKYTSVTSLIGKYHNKFDSYFFSGYKAVETIFNLKGANFKLLSRVVGRENIIDEFKKKATLEELEQYKILKEQILKDWSDKSTKAMLKGTEIHRLKEEEFLKLSEVNINGITYEVSKDNNFSKYDVTSNVLFPEFLVFDHDYKVAGQIDVFLKYDRSLIVQDFKTNKEIKDTNDFENMFPPLEHLTDCTFNHYQLQLSLYAYLLKKNYGLQVDRLEIIHIRDDSEKIIPCRYLEDEVIKVLEHHCK